MSEERIRAEPHQIVATRTNCGLDAKPSQNENNLVDEAEMAQPESKWTEIEN